MFTIRNLLFGKGNYLFGFMMILFISIIYLAFSRTDDNDFDSAKREVLLRRIGHELLLQSGDSTSRVLPVKKIDENEYQISFEKALTFQTDSLVNSTQRLLSKDAFAQDYVVNVLNCDNSSFVYAFAVSKNKKDDSVACLGRKQPVACYVIVLKFKPDVLSLSKNGYLLGSLPLLAFVGFIFMKSSKSRNSLPKTENDIIFTFGLVSFNPQKRQLSINETTQDLTATEARLLRIFASSPNEIIERSRLQKEIWEDEGVIVGRSLDMFISKLRKKLELDPNSTIVVIRSKGYKLEVNS